MTGDLRDRVTIETPATTADPQGGRSTSWQTYAQRWAHVVPWETQQDERLAADAVTAQRRYRVTMRYDAAVTALMRLQWRPYQATTALVLSIHGVSQLPDRMFMRLDCVEATT